MKDLTYLRSFRFGGIALFDVTATALISLGIAVGVKQTCRTGLPLITLITFFILLIIAIVLHDAINVPTMLNYYLGLNSLEDVYKKRRERGEPIY